MPDGRRCVRDGGPAQLVGRLLQDLCPAAGAAMALYAARRRDCAPDDQAACDRGRQGAGSRSDRRAGPSRTRRNRTAAAGYRRDHLPGRGRCDAGKPADTVGARPAAADVPLRSNARPCSRRLAVLCPARRSLPGRDDARMRCFLRWRSRRGAFRRRRRGATGRTRVLGYCRLAFGRPAVDAAGQRVA